MPTSNSSKKVKKDKMLPNSYFKNETTIIPKPNKGTTRKDNYRPISMISIDA